MSFPKLLLSIVAGVLLGQTAAAQSKKPYPIFTPDHFVAAMKTAGQALTAASVSLSKNEIEDAKAYIAISRDRLATTVTFWRDRSKDDAIQKLRATLTKLDALDAALSVDQIDRSAVDALMKDVGSGCQSCHATYRDQDPATKAFRFKPGLVE
jgi:cytochrome c556